VTGQLTICASEPFPPERGLTVWIDRHVDPELCLPDFMGTAAQNQMNVVVIGEQQLKGPFSQLLCRSA
jgi:hypothetical protein